MESKPEMIAARISCQASWNGCRRATDCLLCGERLSIFLDWSWESCDGLERASKCLSYLSRNCRPNRDFRKCGYSIYFVERQWNANLRRRREWKLCTAGEVTVMVSSAKTKGTPTFLSLHQSRQRFGFSRSVSVIPYFAASRHLGAPTAGDSALAAPKPVVVSESLAFRSVSSGLSSACGVTTNGTVYCWGSDYSHPPDVAELHNNVPVRIEARASFDVVSTSTSHLVACGIASDGAGYCWGQDLGTRAKSGAERSNVVAVRVKGETSYRTVSAGRSGALAIGRDGITYEWSYEDLVPKALNISVRLATIDVRGALLCATDTAGAGYCWGDDRAYLGSGSRGNDSGPQQLFGKLTVFLDHGWSLPCLRADNRRSRLLLGQLRRTGEWSPRKLVHSDSSGKCRRDTGCRRSVGRV